MQILKITLLFIIQLLACFTLSAPVGGGTQPIQITDFRPCVCSSWTAWHKHTVSSSHSLRFWVEPPPKWGNEIVVERDFWYLCHFLGSLFVLSACSDDSCVPLHPDHPLHIPSIILFHIIFLSCCSLQNLSHIPSELLLPWNLPALNHLGQHFVLFAICSCAAAGWAASYIWDTVFLLFHGPHFTVFLDHPTDRAALHAQHRKQPPTCAQCLVLAHEGPQWQMVTSPCIQNTWFSVSSSKSGSRHSSH